jgi:hypothetical protein
MDRTEKRREMRGNESRKNSAFKPHYKIPEWVERKRNEKQRYVRDTQSRSNKDQDCLINWDEYEDD